MVRIKRLISFCDKETEDWSVKKFGKPKDKRTGMHEAKTAYVCTQWCSHAGEERIRGANRLK